MQKAITFTANLNGKEVDILVHDLDAFVHADGDSTVAYTDDNGAEGTCTKRELRGLWIDFKYSVL